MAFLCPVLLRTRTASAQELYLDDSPPAPAPPEGQIGYVKLTIDRGPLTRELVALALRSLLLLVVSLLLGTAGAFLIAGRVTGPLEQLTEAVRAFGAGGGFPALSPTSEDEISRLAEAFTTMAQDLEGREREKQKLAERLGHAQRLEAVGRLSQGISHDFKNILSTLKTAVHILQKGSPDNEFVLKYTGRMQVTLDRARELVDRLVTYSKTRGREFRPLDLGALLVRLKPAWREVLGESVPVSLELPAGPVTVVGDAAGLEQLLMNLVYNARDAMSHGGNLSVRLAVVEPVGGSPAARVSVRDTGVGMEPHVRDRLFEPFFTTKPAGSGLGLGLSIVHGIVKEHGGGIHVESAAGKGTTFSVDLPLSRDSATAKPQAAADGAATADAGGGGD